MSARGWKYIAKAERESMLNRLCERKDAVTGQTCGAKPTDFVAIDGKGKHAFCRRCRQEILGTSPWERRMIREDREARQGLLGGGSW